MAKTIKGNPFTMPKAKAKSFEDWAKSIGHTPAPEAEAKNEGSLNFDVPVLKHPQWAEILTYALARDGGKWMVDANAFIRYLITKRLDEDFDNLSRAFQDWKEEDEDGLRPDCEYLPFNSHPKFAEILAYVTTKDEHGFARFRDEKEFKEYLSGMKAYSAAKLNSMYRMWLRFDEQDRQRKIDADALRVQLQSNKARCTTPTSERVTYGMHKKEREDAGDNAKSFVDYRPIPIPPVVSPITGNIVTECFRTIIHELKLHESDETFYIGFQLQEPEGHSPAFYKIEDLIAYCEVMQRTQIAQPAHSYAFGLARIKNATVSSDGTVHGMYAVVGETGFQVGPCTNIEYANHIEEIYTPDMLPSIKSVLLKEREEKKRDLPRFIRRVSVKLWSDKTCELPKEGEQ